MKPSVVQNAGPDPGIGLPPGMRNLLDSWAESGSIKNRRTGGNSVAGILLAVFGLAMFGVMVALGPYSPDAASKLAVRIGLGVGAGAFVAIGLLIALFRDRATFDLKTKQFTRLRGFLPFAKTVAGPFSELSGVALKHRRENEGEDGPIVDVWRIVVEWKEPGIKPVALGRFVGDVYPATHLLGQEVARRLETEFHDRTGQRVVVVGELSNPDAKPAQAPSHSDCVIAAGERSLILTGGSQLRKIGVEASMKVLLITLPIMAVTAGGVLLASRTLWACALLLVPFGLAGLIWGQGRRKIRQVGVEQSVTVASGSVLVERRTPGVDIQPSAIEITQGLLILEEKAPAEGLPLARITLKGPRQRISFGEGLSDEDRSFLIWWLSQQIALQSHSR